MAKIAASFEQDHADAVVAELGRMNVDGLEWRVDEPGDGARGVVPIAVAPSNTAGTSTGSGAPAVAAPFLANNVDGVGAGDNGEGEFLRQARQRGATVITVDAPGETVAAVRRLFERHSASNLVAE